MIWAMDLPITVPPAGGKPCPEHGSTERRAIIVAGPTASGKSALAMRIAARLNGAVINADSMQVYRELRVITARPSPADEARVPHALYGVLPASAAGSAAWWREAALAAMEAARGRGLVPVLCGGTGMYFHVLQNGIAAIPPPGEAAREEARALLASLGAAELHRRLARHDPQTASRLRPEDSQRVARAWEVWRGTGRGLAAWQLEAAVSGSGWAYYAVRLDPPRAELRLAIGARFDAMLREGALEEVRALLGQALDPALPAMRAHGVPELAASVRGEMTLQAARDRACVVTAQYTKRQATWFRHHELAPAARCKNLLARWSDSAQEFERELADMHNFTRGPG